MKRILLVGPTLLVKNILELLNHNTEFSIQITSHDDWAKLVLSIKKEKFKETDIIHFFWGQRKVAEFIWAKIYRVKIINSYVGTDVLRLLKDKKTKKLKAYICNIIADKTFCVSSNLQEELKSLHIKSEIFHRNTTFFPKQIPPLRNSKAIYTYIPKQRAGFYGWPFIEQLIHDFPHLIFYILGHDGENIIQYDNVKFLGWQNNIEKWIKASYIHLRLTEHDGLPRTILEALAFGRHVIFTQKFPFCNYIRDYSELKTTINDLLIEAKLNIEGSKYVRKVYDPNLTRQKLVYLYNSL